MGAKGAYGMIVVTGATGGLGRTVVDDLLDTIGPQRVAVVARDPVRAADLADRDVRVYRANYDDLDSLRVAFQGAERLLFVSSPVIEEEVRIPQHRNVVAAAADAEVGHIIYTSIFGAPTSKLPLAGAHQATEKAILDAGLTYTFLRNAFYSEIFINPSLMAAVVAGELVGAADTRQLNTATRADLAHAAAAVLATEGHEDTAYELSGPLWTFPELATVLTEISGKPVYYREVDPDATGPLSWMYQVIRAGELEKSTDDLDRLLGHPATSLRNAVRAVLSS